MEDSPTLDRPRSGPALSEATERATTVRALAESRLAERGALLPVLHDVQARFGWVDDADVRVVADVLNLSRADVHGVVSFYADFRTAPPPPHRLALCRGEACQAVGAQRLYDATHERFSGEVDIEVAEVFCLGNCALGPSGTVDGQLVGRLSDERIGQLTEEWSR